MVKKLTFLLLLFLIPLFFGCSPEETVNTGSVPKEQNMERYYKIALTVLREYPDFDPEATHTYKENLLISPVSLSFPMAMAANGAAGSTLDEFYSFFNSDSLTSINEDMKNYIDSISEATQLDIADSIWLSDKFKTNEQTLEELKNYYGDEFFIEAFDESTKEKINNWVDEKTKGMIVSIQEKPLTPEDKMVLLNACAFDAKWKEPFENIQDDTEFNGKDGTGKVKMMYSDNIPALTVNNAQAFYKEYEGERFVFFAILPPKDTSMAEFLQSLTEEDLLQKVRSIIKDEFENRTRIGIPEFTGDYSLSLSKLLEEKMGFPLAFSDKADFSKFTSNGESSLYLSEVLQKTHIDINEEGTKAAAATEDMVSVTSVLNEQPEEIILDRPFIYLLLDKDIGMPLFMGVINNLGE